MAVAKVAAVLQGSNIEVARASVALTDRKYSVAFPQKNRHPRWYHLRDTDRRRYDDNGSTHKDGL
jgi:hypothetical protein